MIGGDFSAVIENDADGAAVVHGDLFDTVPQQQFAAEFLVVANERFEDPADAVQRTCKPLPEDALEHDAELAEVHVVGAGAAVEHQRAQEHVDQHGITEEFGEDRAGGERLLVETRLIERVDMLGEPAETVLFAGELTPDFRFQEAEVVGEPEPAPGKRDD